jgi:hypothetical protein
MVDSQRLERGGLVLELVEPRPDGSALLRPRRIGGPWPAAIGLVLALLSCAAPKIASQGPSDPGSAPSPRPESGPGAAG